MFMTTHRQTGFACFAIAMGDSDNAQAIFLGNDDALPYLIYRSSADNEWIALAEPLLDIGKTRPKGFSGLAMCKGYEDYLNVVLIDRQTGQPYLLQQSTYGGWYDQGFLVSETQHEAGFKKVVMCPGNSGNLQVLLLGADDGQVYLIWQDNANGAWVNGTLPLPNPEYSFVTLAAAQDNVSNIQSVLLDTDGTPRGLWQNASNGTWAWYDFPADTLTDGYEDVTIHLGNNSNLQVILLSGDGYPYLTWLENDASNWHNSGQMTNVSGETYSAVASGYGWTSLTEQYLCVLMIASDSGQLYQLFQNPSTGSWTSYSDPIISADGHAKGFNAVAICSDDDEQTAWIVTIGNGNLMPYCVSETWATIGQDWSWVGMLPLPQPFQATKYYTPPLSITNLLEGAGVTPSATPGNVAICLSGGGSRALTAGMGQLRGLAQLSLNGASLLSQAKAISTVSGGSWLGMAYSYLNNSLVSDADFLGTYASPQSLTSQIVNAAVPANMIGARVTDSFGPLDLAEDAIVAMYKGVAPSMVWQIVIAGHILRYYGLYSSGSYGYPMDSFTFNNYTLSGITSDNAALIGEPIYLVADQADPSRGRRPFPICNMSMRVTLNTDLYAAPAQANPFFTGIVSTLAAYDANGDPVGGGGVTSFAFNSLMCYEESPSAYVQQPRQWSLTDSVGVSSAALAAGVWTAVEMIKRDPEKLREILDRRSAELEPAFDARFLRTNPAGRRVFTEEGVNVARQKLVSMTEVMPVPLYYYWAPRPDYDGPDLKPTRFADAGFLDDTGVGGALAYSDVDSLIVFVNSSQAMELTTLGVSSGNGGFIPGTNVKVDDQVPRLFGYRAYDEIVGYVTFKAAGDRGYASVAQMFPSEDFATLLQQLWAASNGGTRPATVLQNLTTIENNWFMVTAGRQIKVLWCYLNPVSSWTGILASDVQSIVSGIKGFPNYSTLDTGLSNQQVTLIANLTAWCVADTLNASAFLEMFQAS
jgi:hypothetical protein